MIFTLRQKPTPNVIQLEFEGAKKIKIDSEGNLVFKFKGTELVHQKPFAYQIVNNEKLAIDVSYIRLGKNRIGFKVGLYDKSKELIIDPLIYSTYLGGSRQDTTKDVAVDSSGNIYLTSSVNSNNFLSTLPPNGINMNDIVVTKLDSTGTQILYNTFVSGSNYDEPYAIDVDSFGNAFVAGYTESPNFPLVFANQSTTSAPNGSDGFITKLSPSGTISYSTYHGSVTDQNDYVESLAVDSSGNAYVVGKTRGSDFPILNGFQTTITSGQDDAYLSKLSSSGSLLYSTYFGGSSLEDAADVDVDNQGNAFVTGRADGSLTLRNPCLSSGAGFAAKFNTNVSGDASLIYSSKITNEGIAIAIDSGGNAYVIGTYSIQNGNQSTGLKLSPTGDCAAWNFPVTSGRVTDIAVDDNGFAYYTADRETITSTHTIPLPKDD